MGLNDFVNDSEEAETMLEPLQNYEKRSLPEIVNQVWGTVQASSRHMVWLLFSRHRIQG